jgi:hypothetical protein
MDDQRFDALAKRVGTSRRGFLKNVVGISGAVAVARLGAGEAEAARRGYSGPPSPSSNGDYRFCTLSGGCCIACSLVFWTSPSTVARRIETCLFDQGRSCETCADNAVAFIEGDCWVA